LLLAPEHAIVASVFTPHAKLLPTETEVNAPDPGLTADPQHATE
jgi:hypothetical protein